MAEKGIRALIVDDEEPLRGIMKIALTYFGIKVVGEAADGEEAIERYKELNPNVVLMDINMPKMDGLTATAGIIALNPDAIVLLITASDDQSAMDKGREVGARGFLRKPLVMDELHKDILSHLRVQLAKEQGVQLEADYYKYQLKPGFRPGDEGKHFEPPPVTGATKAIRERQKQSEHPGTHAEYTPSGKTPVPAAAAVTRPAPAAPPPPFAAPAPPAQPPAPPPASAKPVGTNSGSFRRVSPEVLDIIEKEKSRNTSEVEQLRDEVKRLKRALADASAALRAVADDLSKSAK